MRLLIILKNLFLSSFKGTSVQLLVFLAPRALSQEHRRIDRTRRTARKNLASLLMSKTASVLTASVVSRRSYGQCQGQFPPRRSENFDKWRYFFFV